MPTYKHPCPTCGEYILRDVPACPFCGTTDPFAPGRVASAKTASADQAPGQPPATAPAPASARKCSGCGASLTEGARFCTVCGTLSA